MKAWKVPERCLVTLACLMLVSAFAGSGIVTVEASNPHQGSLIMHMVLDVVNREGYHEIADSIKEELAKIGIEVIFDYRESGVIDDTVWSDYWNFTWDEAPGLGWDMTLEAFSWMPTGLIGFEDSYSSWATPPRGWNIFGWQNEKADDLLHAAVTTLNKTFRKWYIDAWQEEYMHDPPAPVMYYKIRYDITYFELEGWDPVISWWYGAWDLKRAGTTLEDDVTLRWGSSADILSLNPLLASDTASLVLAGQTFDALMKISKDWETGQYKVVPSLARDYPVYSEDGKTVTLPLKQNVTWHDGVKFNATDVKFTFDAVLDKATKAIGYGDFAPLIKSVEIQDEYTVVYHLYEPYADFESLLAQPGKGIIIPEHTLRNVPHQEWKTHPTNTQTPMPGTGSFKFVEWVPDTRWEVEANKNYFLGEPMVDRIINLVITDPDEGFYALVSHEIDFGDCWKWPDVWLLEWLPWYDLTVILNEWPYLDFLGFNLHHPILSNRYVRQAIAHAIPYEHIIKHILPLFWTSGIPATAPIAPVMGWLYNTELQPYEYNLTKAQQYLDMWYYSQVDTDYTKGPVGDTDFSGFVELPDFYIWVKNFGKAPDQWPWSPGNDVDPDFDNNGLVELDDFYMWTGAWGAHYPFEGAR